MRGLLLALVASLGFAFSSQAAITGNLITPDGLPVTGAKVTLHLSENIEAQRARFLSEKPDRSVLATADTDAKGRFSFESPKEPVVVLRVTAPGFAPSLMTVERDEDIGGWSMTPAALRTGRITAGGKPVGGARVIWRGATEIISITDAEGRYSIPDPAKWASRVTILHPDYAIHDDVTRRSGSTAMPVDQTLQQGVQLTGRVVGEDGKSTVKGAVLVAGGWPVGTTGDDGSFAIPRMNPKWDRLEARSGSLAGVRAKSKDRTALTIRLARAGSITGSVRDSRTQAAIQGAEVALRRSGRFDGSGMITSIITDAKGNFALSGLTPESYEMSASHPGYSFTVTAASVAASEKVSRTVLATQLARVTGSVVNEEKQPVAAAAITSEAVSRQGASFMMGGPAMMMTAGARVSAPDGRFVIRIQPDADMQLEARKKGFPGGRSSTVRLAAGERKSGIVITLPGGSTVTGRVIDRDGKPVAGVSVLASEARGAAGGQMVRQMVMGGMRNRDDDNVQTAADGTFSLRVKEGSYDFAFKREGYALKLVRATQVNATTRPLEVTLEPGVEIAGRVTRNGAGVSGVRVNVLGEGDTGESETAADGSFRITNLSPGSVMLNAIKEDEFIQQFRAVTAPVADLLIEIPPSGRITGRVVDKNTKQPVRAFDAGISTQRGGGGMTIMVPPQSRPFTADDGTFVLDSVPAGSTNLVVNAPGYTTARIPNVIVEEGKATAEIEVAMDRGVKVTGKVTGPDGAAVSGVSVRADASGRVMRMPGAMNMAVTDASGEFTLEAQEPGERTVVFNRSGYVSVSRSVTLSGSETRVDAQLSTGVRVSGQVVQENGTPVADASVSAFSAADTGGGSTRADQNGAFQMEGLGPGRYTFRAFKQGFPSAELKDIDVTTGAPVRIVVRSGGTVYGRVTGLSASELTQTVVSANGPGGAGSARVDATGSYRIEGAPTGTVRVMARTSGSFGDGKTSAVKSVQVEPGSSVQQDIEFMTGTTVRGRVTREGRAVNGAMVAFSPRNAQAQTRASTQTNSEGNYEVTGLEDATYNVMVADMQRGTPFSTTFEVRGSGTFNIDMKSAALRGRVIDATTGEPVREAAIEIRERDSSGGARFAMRTIQTDASGTFLIEGVSTGSYHLSAEKDGYGTRVVDVTVGESASEVEIKLTPNPGVTLRIVDGRDGRLLLNAFVRVSDAQNRIVYESPMRFNAGGTAEVKIGLEPGTYRATVIAAGYAPTTLTLSSPSKQTVAITPGGSILVRSQAGGMRRGRLMGSDGREYARIFGPPVFMVDPSPGVTQLDNIAPGAYTLQILGSRDEVVASVQVSVTEGGRAVVEI